MKRKALLLIIPFAAAALAGCQQNVKPCSDANITFQSTISIDVDEKTKIPYTIEGGTCSGELNFTFSKQGIVEITFENGAYYVKGLAEGEVDVTCNGKSTFTVIVGGETPEPGKEVVEVLSVKSAPPTIYEGEELNPSNVILNVKLSDGTQSTAKATSVELVTSKVGKTKGTAWYKSVGSAEFDIEVIAQGQAVYGTEDNPISVSQALATMQIDCPEDTNLTKQAMYCIGTVKEIKNVYHYEGDIGSDCYELVLTDGTNDVIVYRLHSTDDLKDQVAEGNEIKICGYGKNFKGTLEFVDNSETKCILLDNGAPTPPQKEVTGITAATYSKTLYVGGTIAASDVTLTVTYSDGTSGTVKAQSVDGYSTAQAGTTTATAHYGNCTKTFDVEVVAKQTTHAGTEADPFDSADAAKIASGLPEGDATSDSYYIKGTVQKFEETFQTKYGNYSFNIGNEFICWRLKNGSSGADFSEGDIEIGDVVTVYAQIQKFHQDAKDDLPARNLLETKGGYVVKVEKGSQPTEPSLSLNKTSASIKKDAEVTISATVKNTTNPVAWSFVDEASSTVVSMVPSADNKSVVVTGLSVGTAKIKASIAADNLEAVCTITVKEDVPGQGAVYTFSNDKTEAQNITGWTNEKFMQHVVGEGADIITGLKSASNAYIGGNGGNGDAIWNIWDCFKVGKSSAKGEATLLLDGSASFEKIKVLAIGNRDDGTLTINGVTKNVTKKAIKGDLEPIELEYEIEGGISELTLTSKDATSNNYGICITQIEFVGGGTPTPQKTITGVELQGTLAKSSYVAGQTFDPTGLSLKVTYNEGDPDVLTSGFTFNVTNPLEVGEYDLKATYEGHTTEGSVHISVVAKELVSIAITHGMNQTTYQDGSDWNAEGIVVQGTYNDGDIQTISSANYELSYSSEKATGSGSVSVNIVATMSDGSGIKSEAFSQTVTVQEDPVTEPVLVDISIEGSLTKSDYKVGETYSAAGLSVLGHYDNESTKPLDVAITFNKTVAALGDTAIIASVEYEDLSDEKEFNVTVTKVDENTIDVSGVDSYSISADDLGLSGYSSSSNTNFAWTDLAKHDDSGTIQGNYKTGDKAKDSELHNVRAFSKNITYIKFSVGNASADTATAAIRFGASALPTSNSTDIGANTSYALNKVGDFIVSAPSGCGFFSLKWTKGASYYTTIEVHFDQYKADGVQSVSLNKTETTLAVTASETLVATISPSSATNKQVTWSSSNSSVASVDSNGKVTGVAEGTATITVTTVDGSKTATCEVTVTASGGGGGSETTSTPINLGGSVSVVFGGVTYENSIKAGTGSAAGKTSIKVPSGAKKLVFFAAGWNKENVTISVSGGGISKSLQLTSDSGISGDAPFTLSSSTESSFKFEIDVSSLSGETTLSISATAGKRFIIWNASYTK